MRCWSLAQILEARRYGRSAAPEVKRLGRFGSLWSSRSEQCCYRSQRKQTQDLELRLQHNDRE